MIVVEREKNKNQKGVAGKNTLYHAVDGLSPTTCIPSPSTANHYTQSQWVLSNLKMGFRLTSLDAIRRIGCLRLASRISDLKRLGHNIQSKKIKTKTGKWVSVYWLNPKSSAALDGGETNVSQRRGCSRIPAKKKGERQ